MATVGSVHISAALSNIAIKFRAPAMVADKISPIIPVNKEADKYYKFRREELRDLTSLRAAGAEANEVEWDVDSATYSAEEYALRHLLPSRVIANADVPVRPRITTTEKLTKWIMLGFEKRVQAVAQATGNVGGNSVIGTKWDASSGQDPEKDVDTAKVAIRQNAGVDANTIMMSDSVWRALRRFLKTQATNLVYRELLEISRPPNRIWDLDLVVAGGVEDTSVEGQTSVIADVWNDNVLVFFRELSPSIDSLSFMYTFRSRNFRVRTWLNEERDGTMIETSVVQAENVVAKEAAYLLTDALT